jgi:outer membrane autotransporter protein
MTSLRIVVSSLSATGIVSLAGPASAMNGIGHGSGGVGVGSGSITVAAPKAGLNVATLTSLALGDSRILRDAILTELGGGSTGGGVWAAGLGERGRFAATPDSGSTTVDQSGAIAGAETPLGDHLRLGVAADYLHQTTSDPTDAAWSWADRFDLGVYGRSAYGPLRFTVGAAGSWTLVDDHRLDVLSNPYAARFHTAGAQAFGEAKYDARLGMASVQPYANLAWTGAFQPAYAETPGAPITFGASSRSEVLAELGMEVRTPWDLGDVILTPRVRAGWRRAFGQTATSISLSQAGMTWLVTGAPIDRDAATIAADAELTIAGHARLGLTYDALFGAKSQDQNVLGRLGWTF